MKKMSFNNDFDDFDRGFKKFFAFGFVAWVIFALVDLALLAGVVYVAVHFLSKVW